MQSDPVDAAQSETPRPPVRVYPYAAESNVIRKRSVAGTIGLVLAVVAALMGLAALGAIIVVVVALNSWGSNK